MKAIPGAEGVTLAKGSIDRSVFRNLWELSNHHGIEYGLTKELLGDGTKVWRVYSGGSGSVTYNPIGKIVKLGGHTHPSRNPIPSYYYDKARKGYFGDIVNLNRLFYRNLDGPVPHSRIIWGSEFTQTSRYYPSIGR